MTKTSLRANVTPAALAKEIEIAYRALKSPVGGLLSWVIVEGAGDRKAFSRFFQIPEGCRISIAYSKSTVIAAVDNLLKKKSLGVMLPEVIGIVDRDDPEFAVSGSNLPIFLTDYRDLECMIFATDAVLDALERVETKGLLQKYPSDAIVDISVDAAAVVGALYIAAARLNRKHLLRSLPREKYFDAERLEIDRQAIWEFFKDAELAQVAQSIYEKHEHLKIARGHDLFEFLALMLNVGGSMETKDQTRQYLERTFLNCYTIKYFSESSLFKNLHRFQEKRSLRVVRNIS